MYGVEARGVLPFPKAPLLASPPPPPRELLWKLPYELKREVVCAHKNFVEACEGYTLDPAEFRDFGKDSCKVCVLQERWRGRAIVVLVCLKKMKRLRCVCRVL